MKARHVLLLPLCAVGLLLAVLVSQGGAAQPPAEVAQTTSPAQAFAGSEVCAACHGDVSEHLDGTPHGSEAFARLAAQGCESCHGPAAAHTEDPDDPALRPSIQRLSADAQSQICTSCHDGHDQFFWKGSVHETRNVSCTTCHSIHDFKSEDAQLKAANTVEACLSCHKDVRADLWKNSHHPIREGELSCTDCHNPHGSPTPNLIKAASVNEQCYDCHTEKRGPFVWEHPPVRENCMNCHTPHGSNHIKLQKTSVPYLCQQCHSNTRHPGTLYDARNLPTGPSPSNRLFNRGCLNCHAMVHGSNHPSSPFLGD
jgi:DmsE family decaheme c-type cytochrome